MLFITNKTKFKPNKCYYGYRRYLLSLSLSLILLAIHSYWQTSPSLAAEKIGFKLGIFEPSLPITEIRNYAETGKIGDRLKTWLKFISQENQQIIKQILHIQLPLDNLALEELFKTEIGQNFLLNIAQAIALPQNLSLAALHSAIIQGNQSSEGLSILSFLEAYPQTNINIKLIKAVNVVKTVSLPEKNLTIAQNSQLKDNLISTKFWQLAVKYQVIATKNKQYNSCLFGDSISSALGNSLGEQNFNFAISGMSTVSLIEQLKLLIPTGVKCDKAIIAIGTNDALYDISNEMFIKNLQKTIALTRKLNPKEIILIPAFYSTIAATYQPNMAGSISRVDEINYLIYQVAEGENLPVEAEAIQPLFAHKELKHNLTIDGVHLNDKGLEIYRKALLKIINYQTSRSRNI